MSDFKLNKIKAQNEEQKLKGAKILNFLMLTVVCFVWLSILVKSVDLFWGVRDITILLK